MLPDTWLVYALRRAHGNKKDLERFSVLNLTNALQGDKKQSFQAKIETHYLFSTLLTSINSKLIDQSFRT